MSFGLRRSNYLYEKWRLLTSFKKLCRETRNVSLSVSSLDNTSTLKEKLIERFKFNRTNYVTCQRHGHFLGSNLYPCQSVISSKQRTVLQQTPSYSTKISKFSLKNDVFREYLESLEVEFNKYSAEQSAGVKLSNKENGRLVMLRRIMEVYQQLKEKYDEVDELQKMQTDAEMKTLAEEEKEMCMKEIGELEENLVDLMAPDESIDECNVILEVESGAGGQEAMLFAQDILHLYQNHSAHKGWQFSLIKMDNHEAGGIRSASATISGQGVYREMKYEGGVHRVQRVPKTEKAGRIHTSTITVAIFPQPSEIEVVINPKDLRIETFKPGGPGGQAAYKSDFAVRITHFPTGITAECQATRSQLKNQNLAMQVLRSRIYERLLNAQKSEVYSQRKIQVGNKDRSEKIRTFNYPQDRITDHRLGLSLHNIETFMATGQGLQKLVDELLEEAKKENLELIFEDFEKRKKFKVTDKS